MAILFAENSPRCYLTKTPKIMFKKGKIQELGAS